MFQAKSFQPLSFSLQSFKMAEEANSGRSGYWKLFFYNIQEEALRKHEQKQRESAEKRTGAGTEEVATVKAQRIRTKLRPRRASGAAKERRDTEELRTIAEDFALRPIYAQSGPIIPQEITCLIQQNWVKLMGVKVPLTLPVQHELEADNDEEDMELLLLLTA